MKASLTRRDFLKLSGVGVMGIAAAAALVGCSSSESTSDTSSEDSSSTSTSTSDSSSSSSSSSDDLFVSAEDIDTSNMIVADYISTNATSIVINPFAIKSAAVCSYTLYEMLFTTIDGIGSSMAPCIADPTRGGNNSMDVMGFDHEEGSTVYTIYICDNVYDSAGNHLTADDVVFSFEQTLAYGETSGWGSIEGWNAIDETTVEMVCSEELTLKGDIENIFLRCCMVTQAAYEASQSQFVNDGCGTSPYVLTDLESSASAVFEARDDYWQTDYSLRPRSSWANVKKIKVTAISESSQVVTSLQSGDINFGSSVSSTLIDPFMEGGAYSSQFSVYTYLSSGVYYLEPNCNSASLMSDINLRLAVFYCIDNANIVLGAGANAYNQAYALGPDILGDYNQEWKTWENYTTVSDLDLAKEYLDKSSYNGENLKFMYNTGSTGIPEIIQGMLMQIGINVSLSSYDRSTASALLVEPTEWDLYFNVMNTSDYLSSLWSHLMNTDSYSTGLTEGFIDDPYYQELLLNSMNVNSTVDDYNTYWQYTLDNAYVLPLCSSVNNLVFEKNVDSIWLNDKNNAMPNAFIYNSAT